METNNALAFFICTYKKFSFDLNFLGWTRVCNDSAEKYFISKAVHNMEGTKKEFTVNKNCIYNKEFHNAINAVKFDCSKLLMGRLNIHVYLNYYTGFAEYVSCMIDETDTSKVLRKELSVYFDSLATVDKEVENKIWFRTRDNKTRIIISEEINEKDEVSAKEIAKSVVLM